MIQYVCSGLNLIEKIQEKQTSVTFLINVFLSFQQQQCFAKIDGRNEYLMNKSSAAVGKQLFINCTSDRDLNHQLVKIEDVKTVGKKERGFTSESSVGKGCAGRW